MINSLALEELDVLVVENIGNFLCPAELRIGEDARAMIRISRTPCTLSLVFGREQLRSEMAG